MRTFTNLLRFSDSAMQIVALWPFAPVFECPLFGRCWGNSGQKSELSLNGSVASDP
jgi:hypothetical protein